MFSPLHVWDLLEPLPPDPSEKASRKRTAPEPSTPDAFRTFAFQGELKKPYKFDGPDPLEKPHIKSPDAVADKEQHDLPVQQEQQQYAAASPAPPPPVMPTKATPAKAEAETASPPGTPLSPHPTPRAMGSPQVPRGRGRANGSARSRQRDRRRERNTAPPHPSRTAAASPAPPGSGATLHPLPDMTSASDVGGAPQPHAGGAAVGPLAAAASTAARPTALVSMDAVTASAVRVSRPYRRAVRRQQQSTTATTNGDSSNTQRSTRLATVDAVTAAALRVRDAVRHGYMVAWAQRHCSRKTASSSSSTQRGSNGAGKGAGASWGRLLFECVSSVVAVLLCGVVWDGMPWGRLLGRLAGGAA